MQKKIKNGKVKHSLIKKKQFYVNYTLEG